MKIRIRIELTFGRLQRATFREKGIFARAMTTEDGQEKSGLFIAGLNSERARGHFCQRPGLLLTCLLVCQRPKNWRLFFTGRIEPVFSAWVTLSVEIQRANIVGGQNLEGRRASVNSLVKNTGDVGC